ncbi:MAG: DUF4143 domain-containing protein [Propionibacteriaceae bacterium]|jgi:predicted AAA+ superfamily ATPase|nr:DUF4143 domain-containing protein [Propionibacteriaceae bacterium]
MEPPILADLDAWRMSLERRPFTFDAVMRREQGDDFVDELAKLRPNTTIPAALAEPAKEAWLHYNSTGGMPEAVNTWEDERDNELVRQVQRSIWDSYERDLTHYAPMQWMKMEKILLSVPHQLVEKNQKFTYNRVKDGWRAGDLRAPINTLVRSGVVVKVPRVENPTPPLAEVSNRRNFKLYTPDVGLLRGLASFTFPLSSDWFPRDDPRLDAIVQTYVLSHLLSFGMTPYFWHSGNTAIIEFLVEFQGHAIPIKVESADRSASKCLSAYCENTCPQLAVRMTPNGPFDITKKFGTRILTMPLYLAWNLPAYLEEAVEDNH